MSACLTSYMPMLTNNHAVHNTDPNPNPKQTLSFNLTQSENFILKHSQTLPLTQTSPKLQTTPNSEGDPNFGNPPSNRMYI